MNDATNLFETPILFIIFNRPDTTYKVFSQIKKIKPRYLYIVSDGPRIGIENDKEKVIASRKIVDDIDWDCIVHKNYSDTNLGCRERVASGIDWFFKNVEMGIILEDDCLPDLSFFNFCAELLDKYRDDERIMMISGDSSQDGIIRNDYSYYFSRYAHIWGWATWRRSWSKYDIDINKYPIFKKNREMKRVSNNKIIQKYWTRHFDFFYRFKPNSWDTQWTYTLFENSGFCIIPNKNLISNIGFRPDATHSIEERNCDANKASFNIEHINHPAEIFPDQSADEYEEMKLLKVINIEKKERLKYNYFKYRLLERVPKLHSLLKKIKRLLKFLK